MGRFGLFLWSEKYSNVLTEDTNQQRLQKKTKNQPLWNPQARIEILRNRSAADLSDAVAGTFKILNIYTHTHTHLVLSWHLHQLQLLPPEHSCSAFHSLYTLMCCLYKSDYHECVYLRHSLKQVLLSRSKC